jgi:hypothetical protein
MLTMLRYSPFKGTADKDDFWNEPSLSTYTFSISRMLLYSSQSLYERIDVNSNKEYLPAVVHKLPPVHIANAAIAA